MSEMPVEWRLEQQGSPATDVCLSLPEAGTRTDEGRPTITIWSSTGEERMMAGCNKHDYKHKIEKKMTTMKRLEE